MRPDNPYRGILRVPAVLGVLQACGLVLALATDGADAAFAAMVGAPIIVIAVMIFRSKS